MPAPNTPAAKTERLMNLVMTLLYTRRPMPRARIREIVEQYRDAPSDDAFERMFERDKDELRELGIPLVTEEMSVGWDDEPGYRIHQRDYALPDIQFTSDELAVLGLAARTWSHAALAAPAANALRKLRASGVEPDPEAFAGVEARVATSEPAFGALFEALLAETPVRFPYARPGERPGIRHVQPWGLTSQSGHWYLTGFDADRGEARVFRLSRIAGAVAKDGKPGSYVVPPDHDPVAMISRRNAREASGFARVRVRQGTGNLLRRRGGVAQDDGYWTTLLLPYAEPADLVEELASYGPDVVVEQPDALRTALIAHLSAARDAAAGEAMDEPADGGAA